jgi:hypothetical protein
LVCARREKSESAQSEGEMAAMNPVVRLMVPCEEVQSRDTGEVDILGVMSVIDSPLLAFPIEIGFCVCICMSNARGAGVARVIVKNEETNDIVHVSDEYPFDLGDDPLKVIVTRFYIPSCTIPSPGIYRMDFVYNGVGIGDCIVQVRESQ